MYMSNLKRISQSLYALFFLQALVVKADVTDIYNAPSLDNSDTVQFFYLEAPFPFNVPQNIRDAAGPNFDRFGVSHSGLGVWDTTTDVKFTIEFISNDYVGSLLPKVVGNTIQWNNQASIVITNPLIQTNWLYSRLLTTTSAYAWTQLVDYLQENIDQYEFYQPVTGLYLNNSLFNSSVVYSTDDINDVGEVVIGGMDSFTFVDQLVTQLGSYGCDLGAFLQIYATSYDYIASKPGTPSSVSLLNSVDSGAVALWYQDLTNCYVNVYSKASTVSNGAAFFFQTVKKCYHSYAYVYKSPTEVYNMSLGNVSHGEFVTPMLDQYIYDLPPDTTGQREELELIDYLVMAAIFVGCCYGVYYFLNKFFGKKQRRRVSFESERIAARTVENITDGLEDDEQEHRAYFHGKNQQGAMSATWSKAFPTGRLSYSNPMSRNSALATAESTNEES